MTIAEMRAEIEVLIAEGMAATDHLLQTIDHRRMATTPAMERVMDRWMMDLRRVIATRSIAIVVLEQKIEAMARKPKFRLIERDGTPDA